MRYGFDYGKKQSLEGVGFCPYFWFIYFLFFLFFFLVYTYVVHLHRIYMKTYDFLPWFKNIVFLLLEILFTENISMNFILTQFINKMRSDHFNMIVIYKYSPHFIQNSIRIWLKKFKWDVSLLALFWHV